tara:strand:+ start:85 stop:912 length:828 start_codon:yes stop_codon:yes gene_type:complete
MDKLLESKESMVQTINQIIQEYSYGVQLQDSRIQDIQSENKDLQKLVHKMASEIQEKDKILIQNEKTIHDYSVMINGLQEKQEKELNEKEKHSMLRVQDKEIKRLTDELNALKKKDTKEKQNKQDKQSKESFKNLIIGFSPTSSENVVKPTETPPELNLEETVQEVIIEKPSLVEEPVLVEEVKEPAVVEEVKEPVLVEEVKEPVEPAVVEEPVEDVSEEESIDVEIITHYKKEYYIITGETPQYIYQIDDDGGIGDKIGEVQGKKKVFYDSPKK